MVLDCQELTKEAGNSAPSHQTVESSPRAAALADEDHSNARPLLAFPDAWPATYITVHSGRTHYFLVA
jgi:hypothetical protein